MRRLQPIVVLISADAEWKVVSGYYSIKKMQPSPFGEWFFYKYSELLNICGKLIFFHGGWGKVSSSASTQFLIDRWHPQLIINLGTCGGFEGEISKGDIILPRKTIIYDIYELMGDPESHLRFYMADHDNFWMNYPLPLHVINATQVSADRDIFIDDIPGLKSKYQAITADWESGAIAWVANKNQVPCLILRGITDLVGAEGGEAYEGNIEVFYSNTELIMKTLLDSLSNWILIFYQQKIRN